VTGNPVRRSRLLLAAVVCASFAAYAQRIPKPGFNLFSKQQDIQIGPLPRPAISRTRSR